MESEEELKKKIKSKKRLEWILTFVALFFMFVPGMVLYFLVSGPAMSGFKDQSEKLAAINNSEELQEALKEAGKSSEMRNFRMGSMISSIIQPVIWLVIIACVVVGIITWSDRRKLEKKLKEIEKPGSA